MTPARRRSLLTMGDQKYETWMSTLRDCTPADAAAAKPNLPGVPDNLIKRNATVAIEGRLVPGMPECTMEGCSGPCCISCGFEWVVVPRQHCPGQHVRVLTRGSPHSLPGGGLDCAIFGYNVHADWVIVAGRLGSAGDVVLDADLCRIRSGTSTEAHNQLTDTELDRMAAPGPGQKPTTEGLRCPPGPQPPR